MLHYVVKVWVSHAISRNVCQKINNWTLLLIPFNRTIGPMSRVYAKSPGDWGSIRGRVIPNTQKMVLYAALLHTQHYKVRIKGKVEQYREWNYALPYTIIIIMSCRRHEYPLPSLATSPYRSSPLVGLHGHIPNPHRAAECKFKVVILLLPGHMWGP